MTQIFLADGSGVEFDDRTSSLFYDYTNDVGWVGGATGWLVKLTGLFKTTPAEVTTGGFPVHVNPGNPNALSNPVYDRISKNVFVGDAGGTFYRVSSTTAAVTQSAQLDFGTGLVESPLLDQTNGFIYVFASSDGTTNCTVGANAYACSAVYGFGTSFAAGSSGSKAIVGQSVVKGSLPNPNPLYLGGLDSGYYNSVGGTGNLYVCGNTGSDPNIYRLPIMAGVPGTAVAIAPLTPAANKPSCSPVTDFRNPNANVSKQELIFFSVQNNSRACAGKGCLMNFVSLPWQAKATYNLGEEILVLNTSNNTTYIESAASTGTTGSTIPAWSPILGFTTTDGTVSWVNQGKTTMTALGGWTKNTTYALQSRINDGTNVEITIVRGMSGATAPTWNTTVGGQTIDGGATWINAGPWPTANMTVTGGTGGVIIDNASASAGASQVYFFTLGNQVCITSGGAAAGCAMQASQPALK